MLADDYQYYNDDSSTGTDSSGQGSALSAILGSIGVGLQTYSALSTPAQPGYNGAVIAPPAPIYSNVSANATMGNSSLLWIFILAIIGWFAFKNL